MLAPSVERCRAAASPSPLLAPVMTTTFPSMLLPILFVADFLHPVDRFALEPLLNGDVRHGRCRRSAMPVLLTRREPDHVAGANLLDRATPAPGEPATRRHDQRLAQRMRVPRRSSARFEGDAGADHSRGIWRGEQRVDAHRAREVLGRSLSGRL